MQDFNGKGQPLAGDLVGNGVLPSVVGLSDASYVMDQCAHFWVIEAPHGPTSQGICKFCGRVQLFRNSVSSSTWNRGIAKRDDDWL